MQVGKGVTAEKAEKVLAKADGIVEGEDVWFYAKCNNFRPMVDVIVVTNARVLGLSKSEGYKYKALFPQITATSYDPKKGTVEIVTTDGQTMRFKQVSSEDVLAVKQYVDCALAYPAPTSLIDAIAAQGSLGLVNPNCRWYVTARPQGSEAGPKPRNQRAACSGTS